MKNLLSLLNIFKDNGLILWMLMATAVMTASPAQADAGKITITHIPPQAQYLPHPSRIMELTAHLDGSKETNLPLRLVAVLDGRLLDTIAIESVWDYQDKPTYSFQLPAPQEEISYQFILLQNQEVITVSPRYRVRRTCKPDLEVVKNGVDEEQPLGSQSLKLYEITQKLDHELAAYEKSYQLLEDIERLLKD